MYIRKNKAEQRKHFPNAVLNCFFCQIQKHTANPLQTFSILGKTQVSYFRGLQSRTSLQSTGATHTCSNVCSAHTCSAASVAYQSRAPSLWFPTVFCPNAHFDTTHIYYTPTLCGQQSHTCGNSLQGKFTSCFAKHRIFRRMNELKAQQTAIARKNILKAL